MMMTTAGDLVGFEPGASGGGGASNNYLAGLWWHPALLAKVRQPTAYDDSDTEFGNRFWILNSGVTVTGAKVYWDGPGSLTIQCTLWGPSGNVLARGTAPSFSGGIVTVNFTSPYAVADSLLGQPLTISSWETSGSHGYLYTTSSLYGGPPVVPQPPEYGGTSVFVLGSYYASPGDNFPNNGSSGSCSVEPILGAA